MPNDTVWAALARPKVNQGQGKFAESAQQLNRNPAQFRVPPGLANFNPISDGSQDSSLNLCHLVTGVIDHLFHTQCGGNLLRVAAEQRLEMA